MDPYGHANPFGALVIMGVGISAMLVIFGVLALEDSEQTQPSPELQEEVAGPFMPYAAWKDPEGIPADQYLEGYGILKSDLDRDIMRDDYDASLKSADALAKYLFMHELEGSDDLASMEDKLEEKTMLLKHPESIDDMDAWADDLSQTYRGHQDAIDSL